MKKLVYILSLFFVCFNSYASYAQTVVSSTAFSYQLTIPLSLNERKDSTPANNNEIDRLFYDTSVNVLLMITAREGNYTDIRSYLDCSRADLEMKLKKYEGDSSLQLIECKRSKQYPGQIAILHFETNALGNGFDRCIIYFVHHKNKEVQFSFVYNKVNAATVPGYVDQLMQTLKLL